MLIEYSLQLIVKMVDIILDFIFGSISFLPRSIGIFSFEFICFFFDIIIVNIFLLVSIASKPQIYIVQIFSCNNRKRLLSVQCQNLALELTFQRCNFVLHILRCRIQFLGESFSTQRSFRSKHPFYHVLEPLHVRIHFKNVD